MEYLNWELSVLQKSVAYSNLSAAASHVGVSQPQLSRIVSKLEKQLKLVLLDRTAKRNASWTQEAYRLVETYAEMQKNFQLELQKIAKGIEIHHLRVGTLEGLIPVVLPIVKKILEQTSIKVLEIDVEDINELEDRFMKGNLDLLYTMREPAARRKFSYVEVMGHQRFDSFEDHSYLNVMSPFEYGMSNIAKKSTNPDFEQKILISNSLDVRKRWLTSYGGMGKLPSEMLTGKAHKDSFNILLIGAAHLPKEFWEKTKSFSQIK